ncbi:MAG: hypothetical protein D6806_14805, partial [Deltaproteobacteria bacterium]
MEEQIRGYQRILKDNPLDNPAFTALEEIYKGADMWQELAELYLNRLRHVADAAQKIELLEKCSAVFHHRLKDTAKSESLFEQILKLDPENRNALDGLAEIYQKKGNWRKLVESLERLVLVSADKSERAELLDRLARLYQEKLNRPERALVSWQQAISADPTRLELLERIATIYVQRGAFGKAFQVLEQMQQRDSAGAERVGQRFLELGTMLLDEPMFEDLCKKSLEKAAELLSNGAARDALEQLEKNRADRESQLKRLRVAAVQAPDKKTAVSLYRRIAEIHFLAGDNQKNVEDNLAKCLLLNPADDRVLQFMEKYYLSKRRAKELVDRLNQEAERIADRQTKVALLERVAMYTLVHLQDKRAAMECYRRILELDPANGAALASLTEAYQEEGKWAEVVNLMKAQAEKMQDGPEKTELLLQVASIISEKLRDPQAAHFVYEEVLRR